MSGPRGLAEGDHVVSLGGCQVSSITDWVSCLTAALEQRSGGYCISAEHLQQLDVAVTGKTLILRSLRHNGIDCQTVIERVEVDSVKW